MSDMLMNDLIGYVAIPILKWTYETFSQYFSVPTFLGGMFVAFLTVPQSRHVICQLLYRAYCGFVQQVLPLMLVYIGFGSLIGYSLYLIIANCPDVRFIVYDIFETVFYYTAAFLSLFRGNHQETHLRMNSTDVYIK